MPRSPQHGLSRRRFLGRGVRGIGLLGTGIGAAALIAGCTDAPELVEAEVVASRDPMQMHGLALAGVRRPGESDPIAITVQGRRIAEVGEDPVDGVQVIDTRGGFVIPGFTDCHVHMQFADTTEVLAGGVTTVRDLGGPPDAAQALRDQRGPLRVLIAGRILTPVGGYPTRSWGSDGTGREVVDEADAIVAVDEQSLVGAVVLKVALEPGGGAPVFDEATLRAIVDRGRELGLRTTAHVGSPDLLDLAIAAGVQELAHLPQYPVKPEEMIRVAEAGMALVPTLEIRGQDERALEAMGAFHEAGGTVLYGSDLGNGGTTPGIEVEEVRRMLRTGMTPADVLAAATSVPAGYLGLDNGRIEAGAAADLVVLGSDPFEDPSAYDDIRVVVANGDVVG